MTGERHSRKRFFLARNQNFYVFSAFAYGPECNSEPRLIVTPVRRPFRAEMMEIKAETSEETGEDGITWRKLQPPSGYCKLKV